MVGDGAHERIRRAFEGAFKRMCAARTVLELEEELSNALNHLYRFGELCRKRMGDDQAFYSALKGSEQLRGARAAMWARKFDVHDAVVVAKTSTAYSDFYTNMYGVLIWRPLADLPQQADKFERHLDYSSGLQGRPVLDTVHQSFVALEELLSSL